MMTDYARLAREWWNAHWTESDGAAIASLQRLLARVDAEARAEERIECARKIAASLHEPEFLEWDKRDQAEHDEKVRAEERERAAVICDKRAKAHLANTVDPMDAKDAGNVWSRIEAEAIAMAIRALGREP